MYRSMARRYKMLFKSVFFFNVLCCYRKTKLFLLVQLHMRVFVYIDIKKENKKNIYLFRTLAVLSFWSSPVQSSPVRSDPIQSNPIKCSRERMCSPFILYTIASTFIHFALDLFHFRFVLFLYSVFFFSVLWVFKWSRVGFICQ